MNKHVKRILIAVGAIFACLILAVCIYLIYLAASYSRMEDNLPLAVKNNGIKRVEKGVTYTIATYNIGFGAYSPDFSFFMDESELISGKKYKGKYGKARSKEEVRYNTDIMVNTIEMNNYDFVFLQEVDEDGDRSYHINQRAWFEEKIDCASVYAKNYHSPYLYYPFNDPHGKNTSGLLTLSKYKIDGAVRRKLPIASGFSKFWDLDRCFSVSRLSVGDKELVFVNLHLSAYDKGGVIREQQMQVLFGFITEEYAKGNYVIAGGDFNHDICNSSGTFATDELKPDWVKDFPVLPSGFRVAEADNKDVVPTCRSSAMAYEKDKNFTVIVDGFIVSDNVTVCKTINLDTNFECSDHNPVQMEFSLEEL